jgi:hypothetical protein
VIHRFPDGTGGITWFTVEGRLIRRIFGIGFWQRQEALLWSVRGSASADHTSSKPGNAGIATAMPALELSALIRLRSSLTMMLSCVHG